MKAIYLYDTTSREFQSSKLIDDDYVATAGETEIEPSKGLYEPITFPTDDATAWVGTDKVVWQATQDAKQAEAEPQPTEEQQQLAELLKSNASQSALNAQLIKQVNELKAQLATTKTQEAE